jgi:hypothetical protein
MDTRSKAGGDSPHAVDRANSLAMNDYVMESGVNF